MKENEADRIMDVSPEAQREAHTPDGSAPDDDAVVEAYNAARRLLKSIARDVRAYANEAFGRQHVFSRPPEWRAGEEAAETGANLMLCYRHLEDASMRLGKAMQARDNGVSAWLACADCLDPVNCIALGRCRDR